MNRTKVLILGAAGRDFHNFNTVFRGDERYDVVGFTATQIPNIDGRRYPAELAGELYPDGIPIHPEEDLERIVADEGIDQVVFAYSDVSHPYVMHLASRAVAAGADFRIVGPKATMIASSKPVVSICAVRTGAGKSPTSRKVAKTLIDMGKRVVAIRHPMPYGDLVKQAVQRFETLEDLEAHDCTIEEMEEYEPHIANGVVVYAGVDYERILRAAESEADVIVWDGGNNDLPFYKSDLEMVVADPHRPGHELTYFPGEANFRRADVIVIGKQGSASAEGIEAVRRSAREVNPGATILNADMEIVADDPEAIAGKRVLVVEDGPTLTHGEMKYGAGVIAARKYGAAEIVDPRPWVVGEIAETFRHYPEIGALLPAMGYGRKQMDDLAATIARIDCDLVLIATPIDLRRVIAIDRPSMRVGYNLAEIGEPTVAQLLTSFLEGRA
jgi:predicted GTPase